MLIISIDIIIMNNYRNIENFGNDCTTPCLVGDLNPYDFTKALYVAGKNYRIAHSVAPITMEDAEILVKVSTTTNENTTNENTTTETFINQIGVVEKNEMIEEAMKTFTEFVPNECFLDTYLNSNLKAKIKGDSSDTLYQLDIKIVKVPDSDNYRFVCRPHMSSSNKYNDGYFFIVETDSEGNNEVVLSDEAAYIIASGASEYGNVNENDGAAQMAADVFNQYHGTAMPVEEFTNYNNEQTKNDIGLLEINPNNTLLFRFWKTFDQKVLINVFDNGNDSGMSPISYGYMGYTDEKSSVISFIQKESIFLESLDQANEAGANKLLINLNYDLLVPFKIPDFSLNTNLKTNIKFSYNSSSNDGEIKLASYYEDDDNLMYLYTCEVKLPNDDTQKHAFTLNDGIIELGAIQCDTEDDILFTFWETLDKQFLVAKCLKNSIPNCTYTEQVEEGIVDGSRANIYKESLQESEYFLLGKNTDDEFVIVDKFNQTLYYNIDTLNFKVEPIDSLIEYIQLTAKARIYEAIESEVDRLNKEAALAYVDTNNNNNNENTVEDKCDNKTVNFMIFLKILSMIIALFLFMDLDYSEALPIKIFKGFFAMLFSEIYLIYQFIRIVIYGTQ